MQNQASGLRLAGLLALVFCLVFAAGGRVTTLNVLVKLSPSICDYETGAVSAGDLEEAKTQAAAQALTYLYPLPLRCWHVFSQAQTKEQTTAAIASIMETASAAAAGGGLPRLFAVAELDKFAQGHGIQTSRSIKQAPEEILQGGAVNPASFPTPECPGGTCPVMWGMNRINVKPLWALPGLIPFKSFSRPGMVVDTGADLDHKNFKDQINRAVSVTFNDDGNLPEGGMANLESPVAAGDGHGHHTLGTIAAGWGNGDPSGVAGVVGPTKSGMAVCNCWTGAPWGGDRGYRYEDQSKCLNYAVAKKVHYVINMSLGSRTNAPKVMEDAFTDFCNAGGLAVVSAGNSGEDITAGGDAGDLNPELYDGVYPAKFATYPKFKDCIITVGAIDKQDRLADFSPVDRGVGKLASNWGPGVTIAAPGVDIVSTTISSYWDGEGSRDEWSAEAWNGTSMAAPHVAGVALLIRNAWPAATTPQVVRCLKSTATQKAKPHITRPDMKFQGGILNALAAYKCVENLLVKTSPSPAPVSVPSPSPAIPPSSGDHILNIAITMAGICTATPLVDMGTKLANAAVLDVEAYPGVTRGTTIVKSVAPCKDIKVTWNAGANFVGYRFVLSFKATSPAIRDKLWQALRRPSNCLGQSTSFGQPDVAVWPKLVAVPKAAARNIWATNATRNPTNLDYVVPCQPRPGVMAADDYA